MELRYSEPLEPFHCGTIQPFNHISIPFWDLPAKIVSVSLKPLSFISSIYHYLYPSNPLPPPSAEGHALLGSLPELKNYNWEILSFLIAYQSAYGQEGICSLQLVKTFYIISDPLLAKEILQRHKDFVRGESLRIWRKFSPGGLHEGEKTMLLRGRAHKAIGPEQLAHYFPSMMQSAERWMDRLNIYAEENHPFDLMRECEHVALDAVGETLFKRDPGNLNEKNPFDLAIENDELCTQFLDAFHTIFKLMTKRLTSAVANYKNKAGDTFYRWITNSNETIGDTLYDWINTSEVDDFEAAKLTIQQILRPIFEELFLEPDKIDPLSHFKELMDIFGIDIKNPDYDTMLDESLGFLQASFETTSKALGWALHLLSLHPDYQIKLRSQLKAAFGDALPDSKTDFAQETPLLLQVIEETLRLLPPFPFLLRDIKNDTKIGKYNVKKDGTLVISPFFIHHQKHWPDGNDTNPSSECFYPERFTSEMLKEKWQRNHPQYLPFLGGIHGCLGRSFAKQELCVMLTRLLLSFEVLRDDQSHPPQLELCITLQPKTPIYAYLKKISEKSF